MARRGSPGSAGSIRPTRGSDDLVRVACDSHGLVARNRLSGASPLARVTRRSTRVATLRLVTGRDTSREAREAQREAQRRIGAAARVGLAFEMSAEARRISIAGMRSRDPALSEAEARARLLRRLLGAELYAAAYARRIP